VKIGRNDPCWCGSGKKFKKCHLYRENAEPVKVSEVLRSFRVAAENKTCLHPNAGASTCGQPIRSHTIGKSAGLTTIARRGHVYRFKADLEDIFSSKRRNLPILEGLNRASTFPGFCAFHDSDLFRPIDAEPFVGSTEQVFLLMYRSVARELYAKLVFRKATDIMATLDQGKPVDVQHAVQGLSLLASLGGELGLADVASMKQQLDRDLLGSSVDNTRFVIYWLNTKPPLLCSAATQPNRDVLGHPVFDLVSSGVTGSHVACNIVPTDCGGAIVFSWLDGDRHADRYFETLNGIPLKEVPGVVVVHAFDTFENIFAQPDWWEGLPDGLRIELMERFQTVNIQGFSPPPESLILRVMAELDGHVTETTVRL